MCGLVRGTRINAEALAGSCENACESVVAPTAGGESHPALKTLRVVAAGEPAGEF